MGSNRRLGSRLHTVPQSCPYGPATTWPKTGYREANDHDASWSFYFCNRTASKTAVQEFVCYARPQTMHRKAAAYMRMRRKRKAMPLIITKRQTANPHAFDGFTVVYTNGITDIQTANDPVVHSKWQHRYRTRVSSLVVVFWSLRWCLINSGQHRLHRR